MREVDPPPRIASLGELRRRLVARSHLSTRLLVVRLPALERTAWREGLRKARHLEKRACAAFAQAAGRALRAADVVAHERGSDIFIAALTAPTREAATPDIAIDARSALARMCAIVETATRLEVESGWTNCLPGEFAELAPLIERGLKRGAQERERYAFFSAIGHELRTPLASIRGYLETLLDDSVDERTRMRFLSIAYKESLRLSRLVEGMFEISLLDLHVTRSAGSGSTVAAAIDAAVDACAEITATRGITIRRDGPSIGVVQMDADRLTLVLINLIENAVKHGSAGGIVAVAIDASDPELVCVTIEDDGPGVKPGDRERIFALGERGETRAHGNGIGLALVRLLLERAGGRVDVDESALGGARFRVYVPRLATAAG